MNRQPPVMTAAHIEAMREVCSTWPFDKFTPIALLRDIAAHLDSLLQAPVPTTALGYGDWRLDYPPIEPEDCYDCDQ